MPSIPYATPWFFWLMVAKIYYDTHSLKVQHYQIQNSSLGEVLAGLKVGHLSDLYIQGLGPRERKIIEILETEKPDLILLTGDYVQFMGAYDPAVSFFDHLRAPLGSYAVLGNTEYYNENRSCILCHAEKSKSLKIKPSPIFLRNSSALLEHKGKIVNLVGVDDPVSKKDDLKKALQGIRPEGPVILLAHSPEVFEQAARWGCDFIFCGHTHGGQIFLAKYAAKYLPKVFPLDPALKFTERFYKKGKTSMHISPGIGTSYLPFRLGVEPEITFFTFGKASGTLAGSDQALNSSSRKFWNGFSVASFLETFNFFPFPGERSGVIKNKSTENLLFDFESEDELKGLNWECHKWFELSPLGATSGHYSLRATLPPGKYPGIHFREFKEDWTGRKHLRLDVLNPGEEELVFHIRIDDRNSGWEYAHRYDRNFQLKPGMTPIAIPLETLKTNRDARPLDLRHIQKLILFIPDNSEKREIYIDNIRLE